MIASSKYTRALTLRTFFFPSYFFFQLTVAHRSIEITSKEGWGDEFFFLFCFSQLTVAQRGIELPSEKGWGGDELVCLVTEAGGMAGGLVVQVQNREERDRACVSEIK
jgi:hypothetical protein